jgi:hypothetical protein
VLVKALVDGLVALLASAVQRRADRQLPRTGERRQLTSADQDIMEVEPKE